MYKNQGYVLTNTAKEKTGRFIRPVNLHLLLCCLQSLCQLVGAGGSLGATGNTLNAGDNIIDVHAFHQRGDALQVAVAAAEELNILDLAVFNLKNDLSGAGALGLVSILHSVNSFLC